MILAKFRKECFGNSSGPKSPPSDTAFGGEMRRSGKDARKHCHSLPQAIRAVYGAAEVAATTRRRQQQGLSQPMHAHKVTTAAPCQKRARGVAKLQPLIESVICELYEQEAKNQHSVVVEVHSSIGGCQRSEPSPERITTRRK